MVCSECITVLDKGHIIGCDWSGVLRPLMPFCLAKVTCVSGSRSGDDSRDDQFTSLLPFAVFAGLVHCFLPCSSSTSRSTQASLYTAYLRSRVSFFISCVSRFLTSPIKNSRRNFRSASFFFLFSSFFYYLLPTPTTKTPSIISPTPRRYNF